MADVDHSPGIHHRDSGASHHVEDVTVLALRDEHGRRCRMAIADGVLLTDDGAWSRRPPLILQTPAALWEPLLAGSLPARDAWQWCRFHDPDQPGVVRRLAPLSWSRTGRVPVIPLATLDFRLELLDGPFVDATLTVEVHDGQIVAANPGGTRTDVPVLRAPHGALARLATGEIGAIELLENGATAVGDWQELLLLAGLLDSEGWQSEHRCLANVHRALSALGSVVGTDLALALLRHVEGPSGQRTSR